MTPFDRITFDPQIMGGRACIRGTRIPVSVVVGQVAHGETIPDILAGCPELEPADIEQALQYAAWPAKDQNEFPLLRSARPGTLNVEEVRAAENRGVEQEDSARACYTDSGRSSVMPVCGFSTTSATRTGNLR